MPKKKLIKSFGYYGGKYFELKWLLPLLPRADYFVDVFGGSGVVLINRERAIYADVFNDINTDLVAFFRVLRDDPDTLLRSLRLTPYSREEHRRSCEAAPGEISEVEQARRFLVRFGQSFGGIGCAWAATLRTSYRKTSIGNAGVWRGYADRLERIADRFMDVQIECLPAVDVIRRYDAPNTLFYADPPYVTATRSSTSDYGQYEMSDDDHRELAETLAGISGRAAVSGYRSALYDEIFAGWQRFDAPPKKLHVSSEDSGLFRQESLWTNYDPAEASGQATLFAS